MSELWVNLNEALEFYTPSPNDDDFDKAWIRSIRRYLKSVAVEMPTVAPKRGEWLGVDLSGYSDRNDIHCGLCFRPAAGKTNYCPHCGANMGADMRGEEDD